MFLIYLDESGKPHKTDLSENFTIAGIIVNETSWNEIEDKINQLKKSVFGKEWQLYELHMSEILHGNKIYSKFKLDERLKILEKVFDMINNLNIRVVSSVIKKEKMNNKIDIEMWALRLLFERICWNLRDLNNNLKNAGQKEQYGLMIMDSVSFGFDNKVRNKIRGLLLDGTYYENNEFLIEDPLFTCSHWRNLCQIADIIAYAINYKFQKRKLKDIKKHETVENGYNIIDKKIVRKGDSISYSLKVFPE